MLAGFPVCFLASPGLHSGHGRGGVSSASSMGERPTSKLVWLLAGLGSSLTLAFATWRSHVKCWHFSQNASHTCLFHFASLQHVFEMNS